MPPYLRVLPPLLLSLCLLPPAASFAQTAPDVAVEAPIDEEEKAARADFWVRMTKIRDDCDWNLLLQSGREWQKLHPKDGSGWFAEGIAAYFLGDMETAIAALEKSKEINPGSMANANQWLGWARAIHKNFPQLKDQLHPAVFELGDAVKESLPWVEKGRSLRIARNYDEIEKVAQSLQKSNAANINGDPFLEAFFAGASKGKGGTGSLQSQLEAWNKARPASTLARLARIQFWTNEAWKTRGTGWADSVTPAKQERMDECLAQGARLINDLPKTSSQSPLTSICLMQWGQLSQGREFLDSTYQTGATKFPNYFPLHRLRAYLLLPKWYGEEGEVDQFAQQRANRIGGENGDIFYARVVSDLLFNSKDIFAEAGFIYPRFKRGLLALQKRRPNSVSLSNAMLRAAADAEDWTTAQQILLSPLGSHVDARWRQASASMTRFYWSSWRMQTLSHKPIPVDSTAPTENGGDA